MNHLAWGGHLAQSYNAIFRTTPTSIGIPFWVTKYPGPKLMKLTRPPALVAEEQYKRLVTGNLRVESAISNRAKFVSSSLYV